MLASLLAAGCIRDRSCNGEHLRNDLGGSLAEVRSALAARPDLRVFDEAGLAPISVAVSRGVPFVKELLSAGADPNDRNTDGSTALTKAVQLGDPVIVQLLLQHGADLGREKLDPADTSLHSVVETASTPLLLLLARTCSRDMLDRFNCTGSTPFMSAAERNNVAACEILLQNGADINARDVSSEGTTALMLCCEKCPADTVRFLLDHGADPSIRDNVAKSALDYARDRSDADALDIRRMLQAQ